MKNPTTLTIVDIDDPAGAHILKRPLEQVKFPLSKEDRDFISALKEKVIELNAAGLAASQVGMNKQIIAYHVHKDALKWRDNIKELVPLTILINPSYQPLENTGTYMDWEGCFSGKNHYGNVKRYEQIKYQGYDAEGNLIEGTADGFLARLLQHEIDHCQGKLCIDQYDPTYPHGHPDDFLPIRKAELKSKKEKLGLPDDGEFPILNAKSD